MPDGILGSWPAGTPRAAGAARRQRRPSSRPRAAGAAQAVVRPAHGAPAAAPSARSPSLHEATCCCGSRAWQVVQGPARARPASTSTCGAARSSACSGPNGSGKSTFINVVSGHFAASGGRGLVRGPRHHRPARAPHRAGRHRPHLPDPAALRAPERARERRHRGDVRRRRHAQHEAAARGGDEVAATSPGSRQGPVPGPTTSTCTSASSSSWPARWRRGRGWCCSTRCCAA